MRDIQLPGFDKAIFSDTVGFVSDFPTEFIAAFRATLEEVARRTCWFTCATWHIPTTRRSAKTSRTSSNPLASAEEGAPPRIEAWNKVDLLAAEERERLSRKPPPRRIVPYRRSTGEGLDEFRERMAEKLRSGEQVHLMR